MDLYCFDFHGAYLGRLNEGGSFFDPNGIEWARMGKSGAVYDLGGRCIGRIDLQGSFFNADGTCRGYVRDWPQAPRATLPSPLSVRTTRASASSVVPGNGLMGHDHSRDRTVHRTRRIGG